MDDDDNDDSIPYTHREEFHLEFPNHNDSTAHHDDTTPAATVQDQAVYNGDNVLGDGDGENKGIDIHLDGNYGLFGSINGFCNGRKYKSENIFVVANCGDGDDNNSTNDNHTINPTLLPHNIECACCTCYNPDHLVQFCNTTKNGSRA